jgi:hypothetical protein
MQRLCEYFGVAFSENRVHPGLADLDSQFNVVSDVDRLNAVGKQFGIRFREMTGSLRDLMSTVSDSGPAVRFHRRIRETSMSPVQCWLLV